VRGLAAVSAMVGRCAVARVGPRVQALIANTTCTLVAAVGTVVTRVGSGVGGGECSGFGSRMRSREGSRLGCGVGGGFRSREGGGGRSGQMSGGLGGQMSGGLRGKGSGVLGGGLGGEFGGLRGDEGACVAGVRGGAARSAVVLSLAFTLVVVANSSVADATSTLVAVVGAVIARVRSRRRSGVSCRRNSWLRGGILGRSCSDLRARV